MLPFRLSVVVLFLLVSLLLPLFCLCIRSFLMRPNNGGDGLGLGLGLDGLSQFVEAPNYRNGKECPLMKNNESYVSSSDPRSLPSTSRSTSSAKDTVINLISSSIRQALENPLNCARNYLGDILDSCIDRVIYLDSDVVVVDDIVKLWETNLTPTRVIRAPEYCHTNFTKYFTDPFWSDPILSQVFSTRNPCYFNTGVMVMDLVKWREGNYRKRIENWMEV